MTEFVYGGGPLPSSKLDSRPLRAWENPLKALVAQDINDLWAALGDTRNAITGGPWHGFDPQDAAGITALSVAANWRLAVRESDSHLVYWNGTGLTDLSAGGGGSAHVLVDNATPVTQRANLKVDGTLLHFADVAGQSVLSAPGLVPGTRTLTMGSTDLTIGGGSSADLSADRTIALAATLAPKTLSIDDASNTSITDVATFIHTTSGAAGAGIGAGNLYRAENAAGTTRDTVRTAGILTTATDTAEVSAYVVQTRTGGAALAEVARFTNALVTVLGNLTPTTDGSKSCGDNTNGWSTVYGRNFKFAGSSTQIALGNDVGKDFSFTTTDGQVCDLSKTLSQFNAPLLITPGVRSSGSAYLQTWTAPNDTAQTASTNAPDLLYTGGTKQFATGALALFTATKLTAGTISFVGASTATETAGLWQNAVTKGTNATVTRACAAHFEAVGTEGTAVNEVILNRSTSLSNGDIKAMLLLQNAGTEFGGIGLYRETALATTAPALLAAGNAVVATLFSNGMRMAVGLTPFNQAGLSIGASGSEWLKVWTRGIGAGTNGLTIGQSTELIGFFGGTVRVQDATTFTLHSGTMSHDLPVGATSSQIEQCLRQLISTIGGTAGSNLVKADA